MRKLVWSLFGFFVLLVAAIGWMREARSAPPYAPLADCKNGTCTMKEADYNKLRDFHFELLRAAQGAQQQAAEMEEALNEARQMVMRNAFCQGRRT